MNDSPKYLLVDAKVLPEVFGKVVEAKRLIAQGKAKNSSQATQMAGISRSAYYKYKDSVYPYDTKMSDNISTFNVVLEDEPGVLSSLLTQLYKTGANILTVNQNIPSDGVAHVSISARVDEMNCEEYELIAKIKELTGVVDAKRI